MNKTKKIIFLIFIALFSLQNCVDEHFINVEEKTYSAKLFINSEPEGAKIFLQGTDTEKITPDSLTELEKGDYEITLKNIDFKDTTFVASTFDNIKTTKNVQLKPADFFGKIILVTNPPNAQIFLDDVYLNKITVDSITNLKYGSYNVKLKLPNYRDTTIAVELGRDEHLMAQVDLVKYVPAGEIFINSVPEDASIKLNNIVTNLKTPATFKKLYSGTYSVNITEEGFVDTTIVINLAKDEKKIVTVELKELPPSGKVKINSDPEGATIFLQGNNTQYQTPHTFDLPIGPYLVTLKLNEFIDTAFIANSIKNNEMEYSAYLIDTLPNVNTEITHEEISSGVFQKKQINFYFNFNQNIQLDEIILYLPLSSEKHTFSFDSLQLQKGVLAQVNYPTKINGIWRFEIIGKKLGGRKENFNLNLQYTIK